MYQFYVHHPRVRAKVYVISLIFQQPCSFDSTNNTCVIMPTFIPLSIPGNNKTTWRCFIFNSISPPPTTVFDSCFLWITWTLDSLVILMKLGFHQLWKRRTNKSHLMACMNYHPSPDGVWVQTDYNCCLMARKNALRASSTVITKELLLCFCLFLL